MKFENSLVGVCYCCVDIVFSAIVVWFCVVDVVDVVVASAVDVAVYRK